MVVALAEKLRRGRPLWAVGVPNRTASEFAGAEKFWGQDRLDMVERLLAPGDTPEALAEISVGAQLHLTRAVTRNVVDRLQMANLRLTR